MNYSKLITIANGILGSTGEVAPLSVSITPRKKRIAISGPAGNISEHRRIIDRMALLLGTRTRLWIYPFPVYGASAEHDGADIQLTLLGRSPSRVAPDEERVTSTAETRALLGSLAGWLDGLDPAMTHTLTVIDQGRLISPVLHVDTQGDHQGAAEGLAKGLPADIQEYTFGSEGSALLPTGHTLNIYTL